MLIGVPKEIKNHEYRVRLTPTAVREAVHHGHGVVVEINAGAAADVFAKADMIVKVNEPRRARLLCCAMDRCCSPTFICPPIPIRPRA
jgi:alanine dehydrogenase